MCTKENKTITTENGASRSQDAYAKSLQSALSEKPKSFSRAAALLVAAVLLFSAGCAGLGMYLTIDSIDRTVAAEEKALLKEKASTAESVDLANVLRSSTVSRVIDDNEIPAYSESQIRSLDVSRPSGVTVSELKLITSGNLKGLESAFLKAEQDYGVNCLFVIAIASLESADGTICFRPNNMFGYGSSGFSSKAEGIDVVSKALAQKYLKPGASLYSGKTISDVNKRYASSSTWDDKVAARMTSYYATISKSRNANLEKLK